MPQDKGERHGLGTLLEATGVKCQAFTPDLLEAITDLPTARPARGAQRRSKLLFCGRPEGHVTESGLGGAARGAGSEAATWALHQKPSTAGAAVLELDEAEAPENLQRSRARTAGPRGSAPLDRGQCGPGWFSRSLLRTARWVHGSRRASAALTSTAETSTEREPWSRVRQQHPRHLPSSSCCRSTGCYRCGQQSARRLAFWRDRRSLAH